MSSPQPFVATPQCFKDGGFPPYIYRRQDAPASVLQSLQHVVPEAAAPPQHISSGGSARNVTDHHVNPKQIIIHNAPTSVYYEYGLQKEAGTYMSDTGALCTLSYAKTGRSPKDKRVVMEDATKDTIWWGPVNFPLPMDSFLSNRERALDYLDMVETLYVVDALCVWDPKHRFKIRIVATRAYHALFMRTMLIIPTAEQLKDFGKPDFVVYNAGCFPSNRFTPGVSSEASIALCVSRNEMCILGTQYAGEMKKGVLTLMMYLGPVRNILTLHSSATEDPVTHQSTIFFGLSGTGKTTLSADPKRLLIGDDEHVWTDDGVSNVEGGCYAKCIRLSEETEPEIYRAIKFGAVVENVMLESSRAIDYNSAALTENTRCAYPLHFIPNCKVPAVAGHPTAVVLLTCDASGVLPPVSLLTVPQVMYQFISGYTAKMPGVEAGVNEVGATFSPCFGGPFLAWHPAVYAKQLAEKLKAHSAQAYLVNTGWIKGPYGTGRRCPIKVTRAIVDAINNGSILTVPTRKLEGFDFDVPVSIPGLPEGTDPKILYPPESWANAAEYDVARKRLIGMFLENMLKYESKCTPDILAGGPKGELPTGGASKTSMDG